MLLIRKTPLLYFPTVNMAIVLRWRMGCTICICSKVMHSNENISLRIGYVNKTCLTVLNGHNIFFFAKTGVNFVFQNYKLLQFQHLSCYIFMFFILLITASISITLTIIYSTVYNVRTEYNNSYCVLYFYPYFFHTAALHL